MRMRVTAALAATVVVLVGSANGGEAGGKGGRRVTAALAATVVVLVGCDNGGSAVETRERGAAEPVGLSATAASAEADVSPPEPAKPTVTANRRETADAKVQRLYERNGAAFGARSADDYLQKVRAFTDNAPRGTETVKRPNGDTLFYQASTNTF